MTKSVQKIQPLWICITERPNESCEVIMSSNYGVRSGSYDSSWSKKFQDGVTRNDEGMSNVDGVFFEPTHYFLVDSIKKPSEAQDPVGELSEAVMALHKYITQFESRQFNVIDTLGKPGTSALAKCVQLAERELPAKNIELEAEVKKLRKQISEIYDLCHPEDEDLLGDALHDISCVCSGS